MIPSANAKKAAGRKACDLLKDGMIVGLGSGSTAAFFIEELSAKCRKGLKIRAVASSMHSADLARKGGIEVLDINAVSRVDATVDGADEIDPQHRMIKGAGGAHVREKILACASREMIVIVDETKWVSRLGKTKLPVEVLFYGAPSTRSHLEKMGFQGEWRRNPDETLFTTENGNLLFDIRFPSSLSHPEIEDRKIRSVPGVIDTGFFFGIATSIVTGYEDGSVKLDTAAAAKEI